MCNKDFPLLSLNYFELSSLEEHIIGISKFQSPIREHLEQGSVKAVRGLEFTSFFSCFHTSGISKNETRSRDVQQIYSNHFPQSSKPSRNNP
jgi:hypothetical protein